MSCALRPFVDTSSLGNVFSEQSYLTDRECKDWQQDWLKIWRTTATEQAEQSTPKILEQQAEQSKPKILEQTTLESLVQLTFHFQRL